MRCNDFSHVELLRSWWQKHQRREFKGTSPSSLLLTAKTRLFREAWEHCLLMSAYFSGRHLLWIQDVKTFHCWVYYWGLCPPINLFNVVYITMLHDGFRDNNKGNVIRYHKNDWIFKSQGLSNILHQVQYFYRLSNLGSGFWCVSISDVKLPNLLSIDKSNALNIWEVDQWTRCAS